MKRPRLSRDREIHYTGPIHLNRQGLDARITRANLDYAVNTNSSSGGVINGTYGTSDVTASSDWSSFAAVHQEYRVVAMQMRWLPRFNKTYTTGATPGIGAAAIWHQPSIPTPGSIDDVIQNSNYKLFSSGEKIVLEYRARGTEEMAWIPTTATSVHGGMNYFCEGLTSSSLYGVWFITFTVEFRGRR